MPAADINSENSLNDTGWFTSEIQNMLYGFGDSQHPLRETAELVESIVKEQLIQFLNLLSEVAAKIDSKKIGVQEFLILLRHNPVKLRRFCTYLQVKDFRKMVEANDGKEVTDLNDFHTDSKKLQAALTFLQHIDPSGYLSSVADPTKPSPLPDDSLKERYQRIERMTTAMDVQQYLDYAKAKSSSFKRNQPTGKFQDWLLKDSPETARNMTVNAWSILSYFAYETVAQIVDLAFIVRRDYNAGQVSDAVERNAVPRVSPANADLSKPTWSNSMKPLQVAEVMEAIRRFNNTNNLTFTPFRRIGAPPPSCRMLAL